MSCCPTDITAVVSDYQGKGEFITIGDLRVYTIGSGKHAIIIAYDIFGMHPNAVQVADLLASQGFTVVIPDFFRGNPWPTDAYPPKNFEELKSWAMNFTWQKIEPELKSVIAELRKKHEKIGLAGFCWGGRVMFDAAHAGLIDAGATAHPSRLDAKVDGDGVQCPTCVLPSKDESKELEEFLQPALAKNKFVSQNVWERFDDMHHGWMGARGNIPTDYDDTQQSKRAAEGIRIFVDFFRKAFSPYKVSYFPRPGRGEPVRLAFVVAGIPFVDHHIPFDQWPTVKPTTPAGGVPLLEIAGQGIISQSNGILRYVGKLGGLYPTDRFLRAKCDEVMEIVENLHILNSKVMQMPEDKRVAARQELAKGPIPAVYEALEKLHKANGHSTYFVGRGLTIADLKAFGMYKNITSGTYAGVTEDVLTPFKGVLASAHAVADHPRVRAWYEKQQ